MGAQCRHQYDYFFKSSFLLGHWVALYPILLLRGSCCLQTMGQWGLMIHAVGKLLECVILCQDGFIKISWVGVNINNFKVRGIKLSKVNFGCLNQLFRRPQSVHLLIISQEHLRQASRHRGH